MKKLIFYLLLPVLTLSYSCDSQKSQVFEIVSIYDYDYAILDLPLSDIERLIDKEKWDNVRVKNLNTGQLIDQQWNLDKDGETKSLLVGLRIKKDEKTHLEVMVDDQEFEASEIKTYSRFVPERTDDYAWENDKVAFRTFGPEALRLIKESKPGGTFSSGIDAWHKKVPYSIIDKWYEKELLGKGSYHKDTGEGADFYHVGISRGIGGTGLWVNDTLYAAENFINYKTIMQGPIRSEFQLVYNSYKANSISITETKTISLDLDSQLSKFEIQIESIDPIPYLTVGLTLHDNKGEIFSDINKGYFGYWEPMEGTFIGTGVVANPNHIVNSFHHESPYTDQSHWLINLKPDVENKITFFAGFGWDQSNEITSQKDWEMYLDNFSSKVSNPIKISVISKKKTK